MKVTFFSLEDYLFHLPQLPQLPYLKTGLSVTVKEEGVNEKNNSRYKQEVVHPIVKRPLVKQSSKHIINPLKTTHPI